MIRTIGLTMSLVALAACGDGRGTAYSSERAQRSAATYVPVTPGAVPMTDAQVLTGSVAVTPGASPVLSGELPAGTVMTTALAPSTPAPVARFATGPIYSACLGASRAGATQQRCGCVQWVADRQLSADHQRRGAKYFTDQHDLQEVRQSDGRADAEFWEAWKAFGTSAGQICSAT